MLALLPKVFCAGAALVVEAAPKVNGFGAVEFDRAPNTDWLVLLFVALTDSALAILPNPPNPLEVELCVVVDALLFVVELVEGESAVCLFDLNPNLNKLGVEGAAVLGASDILDDSLVVFDSLVFSLIAVALLNGFAI